jgi:hypothetical protein
VELFSLFCLDDVEELMIALFLGDICVKETSLTLFNWIVTSTATPSNGIKVSGVWHEDAWDKSVSMTLGNIVGACSKTNEGQIQQVYTSERVLQNETLAESEQRHSSSARFSDGKTPAV